MEPPGKKKLTRAKSIFYGKKGQTEAVRAIFKKNISGGSNLPSHPRTLIYKRSLVATHVIHDCLVPDTCFRHGSLSLASARADDGDSFRRDSEQQLGALMKKKEVLSGALMMVNRAVVGRNLQQ